MSAVVELDHPHTWPTELRELADDSAEACRGSMPYTNDLEVPGCLHQQVWQVLERHRVRVYHRTRLTSAERQEIILNGLAACSTELLAARVERLVEDGTFSRSVANAVIDGSPLRNREQQRGRLGRFCAVTTLRPLDVDADGVRPFLQPWGGEIGYFWQQDKDLLARFRTIGGVGDRGDPTSLPPESGRYRGEERSPPSVGQRGTSVPIRHSRLDGDGTGRRGTCTPTWASGAGDYQRSETPTSPVGHSVLPYRRNRCGCVR